MSTADQETLALMRQLQDQVLDLKVHHVQGPPFGTPGWTMSISASIQAPCTIKRWVLVADKQTEFQT